MSEKKYPVVTSANVRKVIAHVRASEEFAIQDYIEFRDCSVSYSEDPVKLLEVKLRQLQSKYPSVIPVRGTAGGQFEAEGCEYVHSILSSMPAEALDDPDWWKYLCVTKFLWLVEWRHGGDGRLANLANYGVQAERRNLLLRMFYRADVVYDSGSREPYRLSRQGDEDLWKSHFGAVKVGNCPSVVKAFIKTVFPFESKPVLKTGQVRQLAKNLTRLRSNIILELYDEHKAELLVRQEVEKLKKLSK